MKIIQEGKILNGMYSKVRFSCPVCNSRLEEWKKDLQPVFLFNELHFEFTCPVCKEKVAVEESDLESVRGQLVVGGNGSMDDAISRKAAIELIERMKPYHQDADDIAEMIANMPPAQPERKKRK